MREILTKLKKLSEKTNKNNLFNWLAFLFLIFLSFNIFFSQNISPLFFGIANNQENDVVVFLQKIRSTNYFNDQLIYFKTIYGNHLENKVFAKETLRKSKIKELEQILEKNPQSRDILFSLYQMYLQENNYYKAEKYLNLAKQIDPDIN